MPFLDVSDVLCDPDFADTLTVTRFVEAGVGHGRVQRMLQEHQVSGVVTSDKGDVLQRTPDGQRVTGSILVHTTFVLKAGDEITWSGRVYTVANPNDYSRYGAGFTSAVCDLKPLA